jgi:hypothetical protein
MWEDERVPGWRTSLLRWRWAAWGLTAFCASSATLLFVSNSGWTFLLTVLLAACALRAHVEVGTLKGRLERPAQGCPPRGESRPTATGRRIEPSTYGESPAFFYVAEAGLSALPGHYFVA